jgi:hypothetical protein
MFTIPYKILSNTSSGAVIPVMPSVSSITSPDLSYDYSDLVTPFNRQEKFLALVRLVTGAVDSNKVLVLNLVRTFDIDEAIGLALDYIGEWLNLPRFVLTTPSSYFSFDSAPDGLDRGNWEGTTLLGGQTYLSDDIYRIALKAKVLVNTWDGSLTGIVKVFTTLFPDNIVTVKDGNLAISVTVAGSVLPELEELVLENYFDVTPMGIKCTYNFI